MLESRTPISTFPLNDQEILLRHLHKTAERYVNEHGPHRAPAAARA
jgi:hypothetical protein